jgi:hypothetical protein
VAPTPVDNNCAPGRFGCEGDFGTCGGCIS